MIIIACIFIPYFIGMFGAFIDILGETNYGCIAKWIIGVMILVMLGCTIGIVIKIIQLIDELISWIKYG